MLFRPTSVSALFLCSLHPRREANQTVNSLQRRHMFSSLPPRQLIFSDGRHVLPDGIRRIDRGRGGLHNATPSGVVRQWNVRRDLRLLNANVVAKSVNVGAGAAALHAAAPVFLDDLYVLFASKSAGSLRELERLVAYP